MAAMHFRGSHIKLIAFYYAKNLIRGGTGILYTLAALTVGLTIAAAFITPVEALHKGFNEKRDEFGRRRGDFNNPNNPNMPPMVEIPPMEKKELVERVTKEIGMPVAKWATGGDEELAGFFVRDRPALVSAILMVMLFSTPFLVCLGGFNQLSGDIQYKGLRYLLLRTERANIFFGRFIGTVVFTAVVQAIVMCILFLYLTFKADFYNTGEVAIWLLQGYFAILLFSLPYIALCSWISAAMDGPFVSLVICELLVIFPIIFVAIARGIDDNLRVLGYLLPWPLKFTLLHPNVLYFLLAVADMLLFTALFLILGARHFQKRDL